MTSFISVHITTASAAEADKIAHVLVHEKLAACVNIIPAVRSVYMWEGKLADSNEVLLLVKTRAELFEPLRKIVKTLHSYECPCIVATPITGGYQPYLDWMEWETARPKG